MAYDANVLAQALLDDKKILCYGNGTSAANAQHFAACMLNRFEAERASLPAMAWNEDTVVLTAIANIASMTKFTPSRCACSDTVGDVLLAISTCGNSRNIVKDVEAAVTRDIKIIALMGYAGGELAGLLGQ